MDRQNSSLSLGVEVLFISWRHNLAFSSWYSDLRRKRFRLYRLFVVFVIVFWVLCFVLFLFFAFVSLVNVLWLFSPSFSELGYVRLGYVLLLGLGESGFHC